MSLERLRDIGRVLGVYTAYEQREQLVKEIIAKLGTPTIVMTMTV